MKLYYSKGACSLAVRIVINELGLPCEYEAVNLKTKITETNKNFLDINSKGAVPTLELDNGEILTENAAIQQYLADTAHATTLLPAVGDFKRYRVLEWLNYVSTELHKGAGILFNTAIPEADKDNIFIPLLRSKFTYVDQHLKTNPYLVGDQYTLPDAYFFVIITWMIHFKFNINDWPNVAKYFQTLLQRKAIQKSMQEEGLK